MSCDLGDFARGGGAGQVKGTAGAGERGGGGVPSLLASPPGL